MTLFEHAEARAAALDGMTRASDHADAVTRNPQGNATGLCYEGGEPGGASNASPGSDHQPLIGASQ